MRNGIAVLVLAWLTGCATVVNGRHQRVPISSEPPGAEAAIDCGAGLRYTLTTPDVIALRRKVDRCVVRVGKPGYETQTLYLDAVPARAIWGNFGGAVAGVAFAPYGDDEVMFSLLGGAAISGLSFAIDAMTGAAWKLEPGRVEVKLAPAAESGRPARSERASCGSTFGW